VRVAALCRTQNIFGAGVALLGRGALCRVVELAMRFALSALVIGLLAVGSQQVVNPKPVGIVAGVVLDRTGAAVEGATVQLRGVARIERSALTNARGEFRFEEVAFGTYELHVTRAGFTALVSPVLVKDATPVSLRLKLAASIVHGKKGIGDGSVIGGVPGGVMGGVVGGLPSAPSPNAAPVEMFRNGRVAGQMLGGRAEFNTEAYDRIEANRFRRVSDDPLSTFSIDVDTASYANVRRFLNQGQIPPPDAVRIEELINYFRFNYKDSKEDAPFSVTAEVAACPWNSRHRLALVGLQAKRLTQQETPPRNLVFLLDVSGSMTPPDKLPLVKTAMRMLVDTLTAADRVAIVVYAGASGLVLPSTPGGRKPEIQKAIADLQAGGSTNGAAGIQLAYEIAGQAFIRNGINRVILATDGDFNVGVTSQGELIRLIEEKRERGIFLSVLGVGTGNLKDSTMEKLADKGNGNYAYLDSLQEARRVLIAEAGATLATVAKDVKIQSEFNPRTVGAYKLIGYENRVLQNQDFNDDQKDAGEIGAGHSVTALYEIVPPGEPFQGASVDPLKYQDRSKPNPAAQSGELMTVKLRYKQPDGDVSRLMSRVVHDRVESLTPQLGFAAAVAEFGMLLRKSEFKGDATWSSAQDLARRFRGEDPDGYRAEFVRLLELAAALDAQNMTSPQSRQ
jgi:Ca-activated chloride channel family protein